MCIRVSELLKISKMTKLDLDNVSHISDIHEDQAVSVRVADFLTTIL